MWTMPKKTSAPAMTAEAFDHAVPTILEHADALYRAADECCRQHDRYAKVVERSGLDLEERAAHDLCHACDATLEKLVAAYERAAGPLKPVGNPDWWHKANGLWHASREFIRRHAGCETMTSRLKKHSAEELGSMHTEWELEASALLAMRHACEAYRKSRPEA
jgi:hypothetical protein